MRKRAAARTLTHVGPDGAPRMVDVSDKDVTRRVAVARGHVTVSGEGRRLVRQGALTKGDPLQVARVAGIMAAKRTADLIPLCHQLALSKVEVTIAPSRTGYTVTATVRTTGPTGVEMEALVAVSAAALTIYDMLKAVDREMVIGEICLVEKRGGRRGPYRRK